MIPAGEKEMTGEGINTKLVRKTYVKEIVFVDGLSRAGKFMLAPIVASLERTEHVQVRWLLEHVPVFHDLGQMSTNAAVTLVQTEIELLFYDMLIGRNLNFRESDLTGIINSREPDKYRRRLSSQEGDAAFEGLEAERPILVFATHDALCHPEIFFKAYPNLKMLHIKRHPVDMAASWYRKRTKEMAENPRNAVATVQGNQSVLAWLAYGWEKEFETLPDMDRTIYSLDKMLEMLKRSQSALPKEYNKNVMCIRFEHMVTAPQELLPEICSFLGTTQTDYTEVVLKRERCPRVLSEQDRQEKLSKIRELASDKAFSLLTRIIKDYESGS